MMLLENNQLRYKLHCNPSALNSAEQEVSSSSPSTIKLPLLGP